MAVSNSTFPGKIPNWLLALLSGLLLWAAWPVSPFTFLVFFGFVPLLWLGHRMVSGRKFYLLTGLALAVWNTLTTWWIWNASEIGAVAAVLVNTTLMSIPWLLYRISLRKRSLPQSVAIWIISWMAMEYFHLQNWGLSWPWLTMGNVFADKPNWVQWYEYTGTSGGSLWVLAVNAGVFLWIARRSKNIIYARTTAALLVLPVVISGIILWKTDVVTKSNQNIVVVQPNIDPYNEKFVAGSETQQLQKLIALSESRIDSQTALVVWPETAISRGGWEEEIATDRFYTPIWAFLNRHPQMELFSGMDGYRRIPPGEELTLSARPLGNSGTYYEAFNSAALFRKDTTVSIYHKSKLVPGAETIPSWLGFLAPLVGDFGGIPGTYGTQEERTVFTTNSGTFRIAPAICYESIYGEFMSEYVRSGANLIAIVTNDGWWGNTPGYKQHKQYARLRAIENRRWVARSANTGISCFIDPLGMVHESRPWDEAAAIRYPVTPHQATTFFSRNGDWLSKAFAILFVLSMLALLLQGSIRIKK